MSEQHNNRLQARLLKAEKARDELRGYLKQIGAMVPAQGGGTFENDPPDAIVDALRRYLGSPIAATAGYMEGEEAP